MGFGTIGGGGNRNSGMFEPSEDREEQRKKEVDDLISKYASKKKAAKYGQQDFSQPSYSKPAADYEPSTYSSLSRRNSQLYEPSTLERTYGSGTNTDRTYASVTNTFSSAANPSSYVSAATYTAPSAAYPRDSSLSKYAVPVSSSTAAYPRDSSLSKYAPPVSSTTGSYQPTAAPRRPSITSNDYGSYAADMYGATPKYSALSSSASTANVYSHMSTQESSSKPMSAARRYLNQSKSSSNLFLFPQSTNALLNSNDNPVTNGNNSLTRQQKTLSIHGIPSSTSNRIMPSGGSSSALYGSLASNGNNDDFLIERGSAAIGSSSSKAEDWRQRGSKYSGSKTTSLIQQPVRKMIELRVHKIATNSTNIEFF